MENNIELLTMEESHILSVVEISKVSFPIPWSEQSFRNELTNTFATYIVAKKDDKIIGYGGMWIIIDEGHITNIAVLPEYRKQGVGDAILSKLISLCNEKRVKAMTLEVRESNIAAHKLYEKHGFKTEGIRPRYYEDNGEAALLMWKYWS